MSYHIIFFGSVYVKQKSTVLTVTAPSPPAHVNCRPNRLKPPQTPKTRSIMSFTFWFLVCVSPKRQSSRVVHNTPGVIHARPTPLHVSGPVGPDVSPAQREKI